MSAHGEQAEVRPRKDAIFLRVITPEGTELHDQPCQVLVVPIASGGSLGFLVNHAPMLVHLRAGVVRFKVDGQTHLMAVSGGFLEIENNRAVILADAAELDEDIDVQRARDARQRALARLEQARKDKNSKVDVARAQAALQRSLARLRAAGDQN